MPCKQLEWVDVMIGVDARHPLSSHWLRSSQKYVGVIRVVIHVLQLLLSTFTQQNMCCISESTMKRSQNSSPP